MTPISIYQVDAFTEALFSGNPAAICMMDFDLADQVLQSIAAENNLAETAYVWQTREGFKIRWFTPTIEWTFADTPPWPQHMSYSVYIEPRVQ